MMFLSANINMHHPEMVIQITLDQEKYFCSAHLAIQ